MANMFDELECQFAPRKYQQEILDLVAAEAAAGGRAFHIVAPPGAGKTIVGLQLVIDHSHPALVLAPNEGIRSMPSGPIFHTAASRTPALSVSCP